MKSKKRRVISFFTDIFSFESGIDISNDCAVLYRRNVVIKNIILISNILYTIILTILSIGEKSNWVLTIVSFPLTFLINSTLTKTINKEPNDYLKQQIASYIACFYMFLSAILLYLKLKTGVNSDYIGEAGYILIYYSLVVVSLYQDTKMLKTVFKFVFVIITLIHFTLTYDFVSKDQGDLLSFIRSLFTMEGKDILLRTIILLTFMTVLYTIVSLGEYMQGERKKELMKRKDVQNDFINVVKGLFDSALEEQSIDNGKRKNMKLLAEMSYKLSEFLGNKLEFCEEVMDYSNIHITNHLDLDLSNVTDIEMQFEKLRVQTQLGGMLVKRLNLERKCEDLLTKHLSNSADDVFKEKMKHYQDDIMSQIILICDIYIRLRGNDNNRRPYSHKSAISFIESDFRYYFDTTLYSRFEMFNEDFRKLFEGE